MDPETTLGPLCTEGALRGVLTQIDAAVKGGAKVIASSEEAQPARILPCPPILTNVTPENPAFHQEFFARSLSCSA